MDGKLLQSQSNATMDVKRSGTTWIIDHIRFELRR